MLLPSNRYALRWEYCTPCWGWNYLLWDSWWNFFIRTGLISLCEFHCLFSSQIADRGWFCWFLNMLTYQPALHGGDASSPSFCFARRRITFVPLNLHTKNQTRQWQSYCLQYKYQAISKHGKNSNARPSWSGWGNDKNIVVLQFQARRYVTDLAPAHNFVHQLVTCMPSSRLSMMNSKTILQSK